jgi:beta-lactamase superfamily II metal-dependent hydrolase
VGTFINGENCDSFASITEYFYRIQVFKGSSNSSDKNEASLIVTIEYASQVFVITGDAGYMAELDFITSPSASAIFGDGRADMLTTYLKVGHHGSQTSTSTFLLDFIKPKVAIVSVGTLYNLPSSITMGILDAYDVETYLTRDSSHIVVRCDGNDIKMFFAFDNPPDLTAIWGVVFVAVIVLCFIDLKKTQHIVV